MVYIFLTFTVSVSDVVCPSNSAVVDAAGTDSAAAVVAGSSGSETQVRKAP